MHVPDVLPPGPHSQHDVREEQDNEYSQHARIVSQAGHSAKHVAKVYGVGGNHESGAYVCVGGLDWRAA